MNMRGRGGGARLQHCNLGLFYTSGAACNLGDLLRKHQAFEPFSIIHCSTQFFGNLMNAWARQWETTMQAAISP